jgi:hypothetical protein
VNQKSDVREKEDIMTKRKKEKDEGKPAPPPRKTTAAVAKKPRKKPVRAPLALPRGGGGKFVDVSRMVDLASLVGTTPDKGLDPCRSYRVPGWEAIQFLPAPFRYGSLAALLSIQTSPAFPWGFPGVTRRTATAEEPAVPGGIPTPRPSSPETFTWKEMKESLILRVRPPPPPARPRRSSSLPGYCPEGAFLAVPPPALPESGNYGTPGVVHPPLAKGERRKPPLTTADLKEGVARALASALKCPSSPRPSTSKKTSSAAQPSSPARKRPATFPAGKKKSRSKVCSDSIIFLTFLFF